ncbi:MAG: CotH kinase family protein, partial [Verrucomicrobiota bacterium]
GLDEALAFRLFRMAGTISLNTSYFHLRIIDGALEQDPNNQFEGDNWGLYINLEQADQRFLDERGLPDGNVFNNHFGSSTILNQGSGQPDDRSDLFAFTSTGTGYNRLPIQSESWWETNVELDRYFGYRSVVEAVNHSDLRDRENSIYYHNPVTDKWTMVPWDVDLLYEEFDRWGPDGVQSPVALEQFRKCLGHPALNIRFQNRSRELQDLLLNEDQGWTLIDEFTSRLANIDGGLGWPEVEHARWDRDPRSRSVEGPSTGTGSFFINPYTSSRFPPLGRTLISADFDGMVDWVKQFIVTNGFGGGQLAVLNADAEIPRTPIITYTGQTNFPVS